MSSNINLLPISFGTYELPTFKESRKGDWYEYGSERGDWKNLYPQFLTKLYNESSKHAVIINSKCKFIVGKGFCVEGEMNYKERAKIEAFLRRPNDTDNMTELLAKIVKDKKVYGGFCMGVRINANKQIAALDHINFADVRKGVDEDVYYYTDDWKARNPQNNDDFTEMVSFTWDDAVNTTANYIIYYKEYRPDLNVYPLGDYVSAVPYISADAEIANFTLNSIQQNLSASYIISFNNGEPTEEEMRNIERRFRDYATGTDNAAKPLLSFTDQNSDHPQIIPIPETGLTDRYNQLNDQIRQEIFTAHGIVSPMLFGVKTDTGLGNNADEILTAASLYQNLQVDPEQEVLNDLFNEIIAFNGLRKSLRIVKIEPVQKALSESVVVSVMTKDEIRERIGLPPLEVNQEVMMSSIEDDLIIDQLHNTGFRVSELEVISSHVKEITSCEDAQKFEHDILSNYSFAIGRVLTENEKSVLDVIKRNPKLPVTEIGKALDLNVAEVNEAIQGLQNADALDKGFKPTEDAKKTIQEPLPEEKVFIVYKYVKNPDVSGPPILPQGRTRAFCRKMITLAETRRYTLQQLETLVNGQGQTGINIFTKRGGWYHNPQTDRTTPYCRHIWEMQLVRLKK